MSRWKPLRVLLIIVTVALQACSFSSPFVILNESREPIQIRYTFKRDKFAYPQDAAPFRFHTPQFISVNDLSHDHRQFVDAPPSDFSYDAATGVLEISIGPGAAVCLQQLPNYSQHEGESPDHFDIAELHIVGSEGQIHLTGDEARVQFRKEWSSVFAIRYW